MQKRIPAVLAAAAAMLSGCGLFSDPPTPAAPKEPLIVTHESTVDPIHIRDASVSHIEAHRGGAALRSESWRQVLWEAHYEGVARPDRVAENRSAPEAASIQEKPEQNRSKDASVYSADASVYSKDASIYSGNRRAPDKKTAR